MGTLTGLKVIELAGIGPSPMAGMMLADMGADVIRIERSVDQDSFRPKDPSLRGKKSLVLNLKDRRGVELLLRLAERTDVLFEGYRPGVAERLGIGPEVCMERNPRLIYGRMTGWGQQGPLAHAPGHDINYIALAGALHAIGRAGERPVPPLNLLADMGGGGMLLVVGILAALVERAKSNIGQVVDAAMIDGTAQLMWMVHGMHAAGIWDVTRRGANALDGAAHFYDTYETRDGKYISVGSIEPQFYAALRQHAGLDDERFAAQMDSGAWPELKQEMARVFRTRTRDEWCEIMEGSDVCFAPVLSADEVACHPHHQARGTYIEVDGDVQPAPAPRFSRTQSAVRHGVLPQGAGAEAVLTDMGLTLDEISALKRDCVLF